MNLFFVVLGALFGFLLGYVLGRSAAKSKSQKNVESLLALLLQQFSEFVKQQGAFSSHLNSLSNLSSIVAELKARYEEIKDSEKRLTLERDKRMEEFMQNMKHTFAVAHYLEARYFSVKQNEAGKYRQIVEALLKLLGDIDRRIASIDRALKSISNASDEIKRLALKGRSIASGDVSFEMSTADETIKAEEDARAGN